MRSGVAAVAAVLAVACGSGSEETQAGSEDALVVLPPGGKCSCYAAVFQGVANCDLVYVTNPAAPAFLLREVRLPASTPLPPPPGACTTLCAQMTAAEPLCAPPAAPGSAPRGGGQPAQSVEPGIGD
jgi:hypothetical protein